MIHTDLRKELAIYAHGTWNGWMAYLFSKCSPGDNGTIIIPKWAADRWQRQACTSYGDLSKDEKDSDLEEAEKILTIVREAFYPDPELHKNNHNRLG